MINKFVWILLFSIFSCSTPVKEQQFKTSKYDRSEWDHWIDEDRNCLNTRHEVLLKTSQSPPVFNKKRCAVVSGSWEDYYTGKIHYKSRELDIDHIVSLKEAHESGGSNWSLIQKRTFANDLDNLQVAGRTTNRQKGAKSPRD